MTLESSAGAAPRERSTEPQDRFWQDYLGGALQTARFLGGGVVLDVGCGRGEQLSGLQADGFRALGLEPDGASARTCRARGLIVARGLAEELPFRSGSCDGVLCKVVIPYTDERLALREIARILAPGGVAIIYVHGFGYFLRYLLRHPSFRYKLYAVRSILNTAVYRLIGSRLPGFLGDTIFQSVGRLHDYYSAHGLRFEADISSRSFRGRPVFLGHVVRR